MRPRGMWGWCLVCCGKIQYKGKYNWKFICNILSILMEGDRCTGNLPPAEVLPKERLAQWLRYCRIMHMKRRNAPAWTPGQGETAPWTARFDDFVKHRNPSSIISYSILPTKRSTRDSACATAVPAAAPRTTSKIYSSRFFILFTLIRIVDPLCKSAVVVGGSTPATPRAMSPELKPTIFR